MFTKEYNKISPEDILRHAKQMLNKCLRDILQDEDCDEVRQSSATYGRKRKGYLGNLIEEHVFGLTPNSSPEPDFPEAGVELKTTPLKKSAKNKVLPKERLVFSMIDFEKIVKENWETSSFLKKNSLLLLMFYIYEKELDEENYKFKIIELLNIIEDLPPNDIDIIKQDWQYIVDKIKAGKAHELSEGDTFYLGACTKGSNAKKNFRKQPYSDIRARGRAFSLKQKYIKYLLNKEYLKKSEYSSLLTPSKSDIKESIKKRFKPYIGLTIKEISDRLGRTTKAKDSCAILAREMLGVKTKKIEEFEKADITMKTIRLTHTGRNKESMSFPAIRYIEILDETWENSTLRNTLSQQKFLFVIFKFDNDQNTLRFKDVIFWNMPYQDIENNVKKVWEATQKKIKDCKFFELPCQAADPVCHVRPKGTKGEKFPTHTGEMIKKQSFWLNAKYIHKQINLK